MESFVASLTLAGDLLMHHRQPETKEKRSILVGKPAGNDIPTLECVVASLTLARELLMHHKHLERGRARTRRGCLTKSHLRHSTRCSSVLGERLAHTTVSFPTFEEPATGTARGRRGVLSHEVSPPTQHPVLKCLGKTNSPYHCLFPDFRRARKWDGAR